MLSDDEDSRLPVHIWIDAQLRPLNGRGIFYYVHQRGDRNSGIVMLKINGLNGVCRLLIQQRDIDGNMGWMNVMDKEDVEESKADAYIQKSCSRDPDLWVIEIEDREMNNPFEGKMIEF